MIEEFLSRFAISAVISGFLTALIEALTPNPVKRVRIWFSILMIVFVFYYRLEILSIVNLLLAPDQITSTQISAQHDLEQQFITIGIEDWSEFSSPRANLGLTPGRNVLAGVPFENGWSATTECSHLPNQPQIIHFETNIQNPRKIHFLLQAGYGMREYTGDIIGLITITYNNGSKELIHLTLGETIRDWAWFNPYAVTTTSSPLVQPGWQGSNSDGTRGGMDVLSLPISAEKHELSVTKIELTDLSRQNQSHINPCIHLLALTVEVLQ